MGDDNEHGRGKHTRTDGHSFYYSPRPAGQGGPKRKPKAIAGSNADAEDCRPAGQGGPKRKRKASGDKRRAKKAAKCPHLNKRKQCGHSIGSKQIGHSDILRLASESSSKYVAVRKREHTQSKSSDSTKM